MQGQCGTCEHVAGHVWLLHMLDQTPDAHVVVIWALPPVLWLLLMTMTTMHCLRPPACLPPVTCCVPPACLQAQAWQHLQHQPTPSQQQQQHPALTAPPTQPTSPCGNAPGSEPAASQPLSQARQLAAPAAAAQAALLLLVAAPEVLLAQGVASVGGAAACGAAAAAAAAAG